VDLETKFWPETDWYGGSYHDTIEIAPSKLARLTSPKMGTRVCTLGYGVSGPYGVWAACLFSAWRAGLVGLLLRACTEHRP